MHPNRTVLNMAITINPIFREIKQIATEAKAMAGVLSILEDAVVVGPTIRGAMEHTSISTHMTHRQNSMAHLVVYAVYINNGDHDNPHEPPQNELEGCDISQNTLYSHHVDLARDSDEFEKLHYIYQHFQDSEKMHPIDAESEPTTTDDDSLYLYVNNDIEYRLFEDIVDSYYLDSQIKDNFQCDHDCYSQHRDPTIDSYSNTCTHDYHHITQSIQDLSDSTQQNNLHSIEENASSFTDDTATLCDFSIVDHHSDTENANGTHAHFMPKHPSIHSKRKHAYRNTFGESNIEYHDFDNQDSLTFTDKYTALLQQELQNPYWNLHDQFMTKSYQISKDMDIEMMPHAMYFASDLDTITKINHVPYQTIEYNNNGMFTAKLMNDTPIKILIDNGATPSILPLCTYNKFPILHTYPKTESNTPIHTGRGLITSHFWLEIPLK